MTDYIRVNVSSATSPAILNEYGERKAEITMQLPGNLVNADNVRSARMALMKLQVPLGKLPVCSLSVTGAGSTDPFVNLDACVAILPGTPLQNVVDPAIVHPQYWRHTYEDWVVTQLKVIPNLPQIGRDEEIRTGKHEFYKFSDLFNILEIALRENFHFNYIGVASTMREQPIITFDVNTDNTLKMDVIPMSTLIALPAVDYPSDIIFPKNIIRETTVWGTATITEGEETTTTIINENENYEYIEYSIVVSPTIAEMLPNLPWLKRKKMLSNWPYEDMYILNTEDANVALTNDYVKNHLTFITSRSYEYSLPRITYSFPESDVISMVNISSLILVMNGVSFNQQIFPVNFNNATSKQAQISQIPIIEVYYPLLKNPSDHTATLFIAKENFSDAAPISINPSLLKERFINFKLLYITSKGEMKEILISPSQPFSFQIAFELNH